MLSEAYKNLVGAKRAAIKSLYVGARGGQLRDSYAEDIKEELVADCREILGLVDDILLPGATEDRQQVFYLTMKGDYSRYIAENTEGAARSDAIQNA